MRRVVILAIDLLLISAATVGALFIRQDFSVSPDYLAKLMPYLGLTLTIAFPTLVLGGLSRSMWRLSSMQVYMRIVLAVSLIVTGAVLIGFLGFRLEGISRAIPVLQWILMVFFLVGSRVFVRQIYRQRTERQLRKKHHPTSLDDITEQLDVSETVLLIGINPVTELYLQAVHQFAEDQVTVAGILGRHDRHTGRMIEKCEVLGVQEEVASALQTLATHGHFVNRIVVTMPFEKLSPLTRDALLEIEKTSETKLDLFADRLILTGGDNDLATGAVRSSDHSKPKDELLFSLSDGDLAKMLANPYWRSKRLFDILLAIILLIIFAPVMAVLALLVAIDLGVPIIFWQNRPGFAGRPFYVYKFRTMRGEHNSYGEKLSDNSRQTGLGSFLRRTRLDELPQLFNILIGDMSFIGPRPLLPVDQSRSFAARLLVRPGLSGWAQVHGGREVLAVDKAALDVWYVDHASFWLDFKIFARTIYMVIFGEKPDAEIVGRTWRDLQQAGLCASVLVAGSYAHSAPSVSPKDILGPTLSTPTVNSYNKGRSVTVADQVTLRDDGPPDSKPS